MPNNQQGFDWKALKTDPKMWMRLAMPSKNGKYLENVFKDKENPFEKNNQAAVETLEKLAAEGKLYLRDFGRSRHFHKVEKSGEELKLGAQHEIKLSNSTAGFGLSVLMRMSRAYFKWIGLDGISNWFDGRLKRRAEIKELNNRYKEEYKSLTKEEKKELKALRKHEKNLKKLDEAKELSNATKEEKKELKTLRKREENLKKLDEAKVRANATKKNLDAIRGKETTETLEELEAMLAKADQRAADNRSPEKEFARRALHDHEENLQKVGEARKNANEKKKTLDALRGKETTETLEQLEQMLSNANQIEQRRGGPLSANARKARKALRDYVKSLRELEKTEKKAEVTKKKLDGTLGRKTTETVEQLKAMLSISPEEVNERRAIRRHVENLRKLAEAEKKAEVTKQKQDEPQNVDSPKTKGEMDSPLSQPPTVEQKENTMQPTLLGDQPVQQIPPAPPLPNQFAVNQTTQQEIPGKTKEENEQGENTRDNKITINGVELTEETINQFPPHVVEAFRVIQQMIVEMEANKQANQQTVQQNVEEQLNENQPNELDMGSINDIVEQKIENTTVQQGIEEQLNEDQPNELDMGSINDIVEQPIENTDDQPEVTGGTLEQIFSNNPVQPTADEKVPDQEIDSLLKNGADMEPEQVNIQERHEDQAQMNLQERLAAEKEAMDSVENWKDRLANTLFSHEEGDVVKDYYENIKDKPDGTYLLAGTVCGLLSAGSDPESKKQIMEGLLSGKPLGNEYSTRINESVAAYHNAVEQMSRGNRDPMTKLITDAALELGRQASQEDGLSPRHVMIGRMISNAMSLADENKLILNCNEEQWATIRGAFQMSKLAERHHNAKQYLGQEPMDVSSKDGRKAVRDLLMGNAIENLIKVGKYHGQQTTDVQLLMGSGCLTVERLTKMMSATQIRKGITEERVRDIMEMPNSFDSARTAKQLGEELLSIAQEVSDFYGRERQMDMQKQNQPENEQQLNPAQIM